jgi:hypothetical protein
MPSIRLQLCRGAVVRTLTCSYNEDDEGSVMSDEEEFEEEELEINGAHKFAIMIAGAIAAWWVENKVEELYLHVLKKRRSR